MAGATVFLFTTAAVFFLAFLALDVLHKAFEQYKLRYVTKSMNDLSDMVLFIEPGQVLLLNLASPCRFAAAGYWLGGALSATLAGVGGLPAPSSPPSGSPALAPTGELSACILASSPLGTAFCFTASRPALMEPMLAHAHAYILLSVILILEAIGFLLIRRIVAIDV